MRLQKWAKSSHDRLVSLSRLWEGIPKLLTVHPLQPQISLLQASSLVSFLTLPSRPCLRKSWDSQKAKVTQQAALCWNPGCLSRLIFSAGARIQPGLTWVSLPNSFCTRVPWELTKKAFAGGVKNQYFSICLDTGGLVLAVQGESEWNKRIRGTDRFHGALRVFEN